MMVGAMSVVRLYTVVAMIAGLIQLEGIKKVSMIRKYMYHNHKLQTNPWHRDEEPHNNHTTQGRQTKQTNQLSLSLLHRDDFKTNSLLDT